MQTMDALADYNTYGWTPDISLTEDENYMDLVLLVVRSSILKQGSMACLLVQPEDGDEPLNELDMSTHYISRIVSAATNRSLYKADSSDIHAEIHAIGRAAQNGQSTNNCTAYITMPPCRHCMGALLMAGVAKIVSRYPLRDEVAAVAQEYGIETVAITDYVEQRARIDAIVQRYNELQAEEAQDDKSEEDGISFHDSPLWS
jgi:tRNA(Arg) A34 adenosine deaminase TadA